MLVKFVSACALLLAASVALGEAIECWECKSLGCGSPFNQYNFTYVKKCKAPAEDQGCFKYNMHFSLIGKTGGVIRGCGTQTPNTDEFDLHTSVQHDCYANFCNTASPTTSLSGPLVTLLAVALTALLHRHLTNN